MSEREIRQRTPHVSTWLSHRIASLRVIEYRRRQRRVIPQNLYADVVDTKRPETR